MLAHIEQQMVDRLTHQLTPAGLPNPRVEVLAWPDNPTAYKPRHANGAVLVIYKGSQRDDTDDMGGRVVACMLDFEIGLIARTLRDPNPHEPSESVGRRGAYALLSDCINALKGWTPHGASGCVQIKGDQFSGYNEGTWTYHIDCCVPFVDVVTMPCPITEYNTGRCCDQLEDAKNA